MYFPEKAYYNLLTSKKSCKRNESLKSGLKPKSTERIPPEPTLEPMPEPTPRTPQESTLEPTPEPMLEPESMSKLPPTAVLTVPMSFRQ